MFYVHAIVTVYTKAADGSAVDKGSQGKVIKSTLKGATIELSDGREVFVDHTDWEVAGEDWRRA